MIYKEDYAGKTAGILSDLNTYLADDRFIGIVMTDVELDDIPLFLKKSFVFQWHTDEKRFRIMRPVFIDEQKAISAELQSIPKRFGPVANILVPYPKDRGEPKTKLEGILKNSGIQITTDSRSSKVTIVFFTANKETFDKRRGTIKEQENAIDKKIWRVYKVVAITDFKPKEDLDFLRKLLAEGYYVVA